MLDRVLIPAVSACVALATPVHADWGGVATNSDGIGWGFSAGWGTQRQAHDRAMHYCHEFSKDNAGCEVVLTTRRCAAVARGSVKFAPRLFVSEAGNRDAAEAMAMAECRDIAGATCELRRKFCANDL